MSNPKKPARLWLRRRKGREPTWVIRFGKAETSTGHRECDLPEAEKFFADWLGENTRPNTKERSLDKIYIQEVLNLYGKDIAPERASRATIGYHLAVLSRYWGDKTLAEVDGRRSREYTAGRVEAGIQSVTARRELKTLAAAINHWGRECPAGLAMPKVTLPPEGTPRLLCFERSEIARMLWAARKRKLGYVARFILIGFYTGTRRTAILSLRWNVSLTGGSIDIDRGIIYRKGSAERETSKRRPPVKIGARLLHFLRHWRRNDTAREGASNVIHRHGSPISPQTLARGFAQVVQDAGLGPEYTPHALRHTCCSVMLRQGKSPWEVGKFVGATAEEIQRTYGHSELEVALEREKRA